MVGATGVLMGLLLCSTVIAAECPRTVAEPGDSGDSKLFWYGTASLSARIPRDGYWYGMGPEKDYADKLFIRSAGYRPPGELSLSVCGRRLDGDGQPARVSEPTNAYVGSWAILVGVSLPSAGCWEFVLSYQGQELTFVVEAESKGLSKGAATGFPSRDGEEN